MTKTCTKALLLLLPMLGFAWSYWEQKGIVNCYIRDIEHDSSNAGLYCLFESPQDFSSHPNFIESYSPMESWFMYAFSIPNEFDDDYDKFLDSKYSTFSTAYKDHILKFYGHDRVASRYEVPMNRKPDKPGLTQILFPKDSDREKYIRERTGCDYENWWEVLSRIDSKEIFHNRMLPKYEEVNET